MSFLHERLNLSLQRVAKIDIYACASIRFVHDHTLQGDGSVCEIVPPGEAPARQFISNR